VKEVRKIIRETLFEIVFREDQYPISDPPLYSDSDYKKRGGKIFYKSPEEFLSLVPKLTLDDESIENIEILKDMIESDQEIDPPTLYVDGDDIVNHDGRHRAYAAIKSGIEEIPILVIDREGREIKGFNFNPQKKYFNAK